MKNNTISINGMVFQTVIAETEQEQQYGLMWKEWPPPIMSFPYSQASYHKFWMKNTISPLDIVFCRSGSVVGVFKGTPLSTELIGPNEPSDLVVEFPAGYADKYGIVIGSNVGLATT
ncbi:MAG: DUF192 domain-containing protein [Clostridia bacterium]|jgi:hypothetical protein